VVISLIGFAVTIIGVRKTKNAADSAAAAAEAARRSMKLYDALVEFSAVIATLEEIKRLHRQSAWALLPERYSASRKRLIALRESVPTLTDAQMRAVQTAISSFSEMEQRIEKYQSQPDKLNTARLNAAVSEVIDNLLAVLSQLKATTGTGVAI
jgi:hypothetical protein